MKKVFLVLALVAVYGVSIAMSGSSAVIVNNTEVTIVADMDDNKVAMAEVEKEKEAKAKTKAKDAKGEGCATAKSEAKSEGCGEKTAAKKDCSSSCDGKKK